jgi:hypothetical protein
MVDVARALSGIGAAFKNEIPQFQQRIQQEDLYKMKMADMDMARQDAQAKREEERKKTLFQDAATARQYFDRGDFGSIADIARDRLEILTPMGVNTRDSQQMLQLADAARAGDFTAIKGLKDQLDTIYSVGSLYNVYGSGSTPASFRALELQAQAAGIPKGSPEYEEWMRYGGATREEGAKGLTRFVNGSYIQVTGTGNRVYDTSGTEVTDPTQRQEVIDKGYDSGILREGEIAAQRAQATGSEERAQGIINKGLDAANSTAVLRRSLALLDRVATGGFNRVAFATKKLFGVEGGDEGELSANLGKAVLSQLRATFGAAFTAKEGESLKEIEAGFGSSVDTNKSLLNNALVIAENSAQKAIRRAELRGDYETADEIEAALQFNLADIEAEFAEQNPSSASGGSLPMITTQAAFDALPSGAQYIEDDSGTIYRKP